MLLTYDPAGGERQEWQFTPDEMLNHESELIERRTDWCWQEFLQNLQKGSTLARRALLWTFQRRVHHTLRFEDVTFRQGELVLEFDRGELVRMRDAVVKAADVPGVDKEQILRTMQDEIDRLDDGTDGGKAPAPSDA